MNQLIIIVNKLKTIINLCFVIFLLLIIIPIFISLIRIYLFNESKESWIDCKIEHPDKCPDILFMQKRIHPFFAEYKYKIIFINGSNIKTGWLPINTGGRTFINVYWYQKENNVGPYIRLQDRHGEYLLDLVELKVYYVLNKNRNTFIFEWLEDTDGYSLIENNSDENKPFISINCKEITYKNITNTILTKTKGKYIGRIDDESNEIQFMSYLMSNEEDINPVNDN